MSSSDKPSSSTYPFPTVSKGLTIPRAKVYKSPLGYQPGNPEPQLLSLRVTENTPAPSVAEDTVNVPIESTPERSLARNSGRFCPPSRSWLCALIAILFIIVLTILALVIWWIVTHPTPSSTTTTYSTTILTTTDTTSGVTELSTNSPSQTKLTTTTSVTTLKTTTPATTTYQPTTISTTTTIEPTTVTIVQSPCETANPCKNGGLCVSKLNSTGMYDTPHCNCSEGTDEEAENPRCTKIDCGDTVIYGSSYVNKTLKSPEYYYPVSLDDVSCDYSLRANTSYEKNITYVVKIFVQAEFSNESDCDTDYLLIRRRGIETGEIIRCCQDNCTRGVDLSHVETQLFDVLYRSKHKNKGFTIDIREDITEHCANFPCNNGGTCFNVVKSNLRIAACSCLPPFIPPHCDEQVEDPCATAFCDGDNTMECQGYNQTCYYCHCFPDCRNCDEYCSPDSPTSDYKSDLICPPLKLEHSQHVHDN